MPKPDPKSGWSTVMPEYQIGDRRTPTCKKADCDVKENPEHWVDITLLPPYSKGPALLAMLKRIHDAEFSFGKWPSESEIVALIARAEPKP